MLGWMIHHDAEAKSLIAESDTSGEMENRQRTLHHARRAQTISAKKIDRREVFGAPSRAGHSW